MLSDRDKQIARQIVKEIRARLQFLVDVGLDYLTLSRSATTLSGGESQRIRLATQIGSQLMGVLYVLDEPSIGLHPRDQARLIKTLQAHARPGQHRARGRARRRHDGWPPTGSSTWARARASMAATSSPKARQSDILKDKTSLTGAYLSGRKRIAVPKQRRTGNGKKITLIGAHENNLKNIDVDIPLGKFVCVTGVSGSGKSTLMVECLYKALANSAERRAWSAPAASTDVDGVEALDKIINIDQHPDRPHAAHQPGHLHRLVRRHLRDLFAELPDSKMRGYKTGRFSLQREGRALRGVRGPGRDPDRDAVHARHVRDRAMCATARASTARRCRFATRTRTSPKCWT